MVRLRTASLAGVALLTIAGSLALAMSNRPHSSSPQPQHGSAQPTFPAESPPKPLQKPEFLGVVLARATADIAPRFTGRLRSVHVRLGDRVAAGSPLAELDLPSIQYELRMAEANIQAARVEQERATVELAEIEERLKRRQSLYDESLVSAEDLSAARHQQKLADARARATQAQLAERRAQVDRLRKDNTDLVIVAPFTGIIAARYADPGSNVSPSTPILRLISADDLFVRFAVPEGQTSGLSAGKTVLVQIGENRAPHRATIDKVSPEVDAASRMVFIEAELSTSESKTDVRVGELVHISIE